MSKPMIRIHNTQTDEIIDREMTDAEFAIYQKEEKEIKDFIAKEEIKRNNRKSALAKLAALGLTEDEIAAL